MSQLAPTRDLLDWFLLILFCLAGMGIGAFIVLVIAAFV